jgi:hypothetical protein
VQSRLSRIIGIGTRELEVITTTQIPPEPSTTPSATTEEDDVTFDTSPTSYLSTTPPTPTTEAGEKSWIQEPEGYVTLILFGTGILLLGLGVVAYKFWQSRSMKAKGFKNFP